MIGHNEDTEQQMRTLKFIGILRLSRLVRLRKIIMFLNLLKSDFKFGVRILLVLIGFVMCIHWIICLKYMVIIDDFASRTKGAKFIDHWAPPTDLNDSYKEGFYDQDLILQYMILGYYSFLILSGNDFAP